MEENILRIFAQSTSRYFQTVAGEATAVLPPYLREEGDSITMDYSAIIGISGNYRGSVLYTAPSEMLSEVLPRIGEKSGEARLCSDLVGEIANTVAGNARELLGSGFMISPPLVLGGDSYEVTSSKAAQSFIIPVEWAGHRSLLLISLEKQEK